MNEKIRILMALGNTGMGGAQAFVLNLIKNIDLSRFQVDLAVDTEKPDGISEAVRSLGCIIYILPYFKVYNYPSYVKAWDIFFRTHHYDIVHAHSTNSASVYLKIAKRYGCATIAHSHSAGYRGNVIQRLVKKYYAHKVRGVADYWFACSDKAAERLFGADYRNYKNYYDIPNAINAENYFYSKEKAQKIRKELGVKDDELLCGHIGTFSTPKNHSFLIDIFSEVVKLNPKARFVCCGTGALLPAVKEKAEQMGVLDRIQFPGVVMNANEYMMAMDVFVFPSLFEGFPISIIEAEASGLPIVMSDVITEEVDMSELVNRKSLRDSSTEWARTIIRLKHNDRRAYNNLIAESKYNMRTSIKLISSLYEELAANKSELL